MYLVRTLKSRDRAPSKVGREEGRMGRGRGREREWCVWGGGKRNSVDLTAHL